MLALIGTLISIAAPSAHAQQTRPPAFEVASVKPAGTECRGKRTSDLQEVRYSNFSLKGLVRDAYQVELFQINAPAWLDSQCYDVAARLPEGASKEQIPAMLQALLAERFHMKVHMETSPGRVYAIIVAKSGPRLTPSQEQSDRTAAVKIGSNRIEFASATLDSFSSALSVLLDRPIVNLTELQGRYDIEVNITREELAGIRRPPDAVDSGLLPDNNTSSSIFTALQELGLKLESRNLPVQHIVVDSAEKVPTVN